jgi:hypothetical protein
LREISRKLKDKKKRYRPSCASWRDANRLGSSLARPATCIPFYNPCLHHDQYFSRDSSHIGTLRARYRAECRNVANATVSTIDDNGEAHVAYEDGDEEDLTREDHKNILEAYGKELFKEIVSGILPAFDCLENRLTGNSNSTVCSSLSLRT